MKRIRVAASRPYVVTVGPGALAEAAEAVAGASGVVLVSDANVAPLWRAALGPIACAPLLALEAGEGAKRLAVVERVLDFLAAERLDRRAVLVALGGGVVGDVGALAASLYVRGIDVVQCPTTLLAQVDASVGGKTAVNLTAGKNLAGTFHQPRAVLADTATLATLPDPELANGLGEVVKSALVGAPDLLDLLEASAAEIRARDPEVLAGVVERCVRVKAEVVARDEREADARRALNLGHTFAHAIERVAGYGRVAHGEAVAVGLVLALRASEREGLLVDGTLPSRVTRLLRLLGIAAELQELRGRGLALAPEDLADALRHDKKASRGTPLFVLPRAAGDLALGVPLEADLAASLFA